MVTSERYVGEAAAGLRGSDLPDREVKSTANPARETAAPLSVILFSGTDDKLHAAALMIAAAAELQRPVDVLLQYWALDAFRSDRVDQSHGLSTESRQGWRIERSDAIREQAAAWPELLRAAKRTGNVRISACAASLDVMGLERSELDALVDDVAGIAEFSLRHHPAGQLLFV